MSKGTILIVENRVAHIYPRRRRLEDEGYTVWEAHSPSKARSKLETGLVHLAIVDVRLLYEDDEQDWSGIELAKKICDSYDAEIPVLIVTAYADYEALRRARGPGADGFPPARDFIDKSEGLDRVVEAVRLAFETQVMINPSLEVKFGGPLSFQCMASLIADGPHQHPEGERESLLPRARRVRKVLQRELELRELFCKLFHDCQSIIVYPMPQGRGGSVVAAVRPVMDAGPQESVIVKIGARADSIREVRNYDAYVKPYASRWATQRKNHRTTVHFGAVAYSIAGGELENTQRFSDFYRASAPAKIHRALHNLFESTCRLWYNQDVQEVDNKSVRELYMKRFRLVPGQSGSQELKAQIEEICRRASLRREEVHYEPDKSLTFSISDQQIQFGDPAKWVYDDLGVDQPAASCLITHGDLNGDNVLVDTECHTWLIDFATTGLGPALRDFAELEAVVKFELLTPRALSELYQFEDRLINQVQALDDALDHGAKLQLDLENALSVIGEIRRCAYRVPGADTRDYFVGLLFNAIRAVFASGTPSLGQISPGLTRKLHALLSAAMICERLKHWPEPAESETTR